MLNANFLSRERLEELGFAALGKDVLIHESCVLVGCDRMSIGEHVRIDSFCVITAREELDIGAYSHIASRASLVGGYGISIAECCGVSFGATILSASDDFSAGALMGPQIPDSLRSVITGRVRLDRYSCVGAHSVVLPASCVGEGATVGALSLVNGTLEPWTVHAGVPAKPVGERNKEGVLNAAKQLSGKS